MRIRIDMAMLCVAPLPVSWFVCNEPKLLMVFCNVIIIVLFHLYAPKRYCFGQDLAPFQPN